MGVLGLTPPGLPCESIASDEVCASHLYAILYEKGLGAVGGVVPVKGAVNC